jgi:hypothetical protein
MFSLAEEKVKIWIRNSVLPITVPLQNKQVY